MSQYSETIGSFIRTGNYPLEADLVFNSYADLQEWAENNFTILHEGLLKVVVENGVQELYWVVKQGDNLVFEKFVRGTGLDKNITALNTTVGNIADGTTLPQGMSFTDFVIKMLVSPIDPIYNIEIDPSDDIVEVGTQISGAVGTYVQNLGGTITNATAVVVQGFVDETTPTVTYSGNNVNINFSGRVEEGTNKVRSTVYFNSNSDFPEISAGSKTAEKVIEGKRACFIKSGIAPTTNNGIREGNHHLINESITDNLNVGSTSIWIAIPADNQLTKVIDTEALNAVITNNFKRVNTVRVDGATPGKDTINYDIYLMEGYGPFSALHKLIFTIE